MHVLIVGAVSPLNLGKLMMMLLMMLHRVEDTLNRKSKIEILAFEEFRVLGGSSAEEVGEGVWWVEIRD